MKNKLEKEPTLKTFGNKELGAIIIRDAIINLMSAAKIREWMGSLGVTEKAAELIEIYGDPCSENALMKQGFDESNFTSEGLKQELTAGLEKFLALSPLEQKEYIKDLKNRTAKKVLNQV